MTTLVMQLPTWFAPAMWGLSAVFYLLALCLDGFYIEGDNPRAWAPGIGLLTAGWFTVFDGVLAWLANPLLFMAWISIASGAMSSAWYYSLAALILSLSFLGVRKITTSESGHKSKIIGLGLGYWCWMLSSLTCTAGCAGRHWVPL